MRDVRCTDGTFSHAGGKQGACSHHGGIACGTKAATPLVGAQQAARKRKPVVAFVVTQIAFFAFQTWTESREPAREAA